MAYRDLPPLTDEDGEVRELTDEDLLWFLNNSDFGDPAEATEFLERREEFFRAAAEVGIEREAFLLLEPSKPGFLQRAVKALESLLRNTRHAAE